MKPQKPNSNRATMRLSPSSRPQVKYTFEAKDSGAERKKTDLDVTQILVDPDLVDKAGALSVLLKNTRNTASINCKSVSPTSESKNAMAPTSELKKRPAQYISNFNRVRSPQALSWRFGGYFDTTRCADGNHLGQGNNQHHNRLNTPNRQYQLNSENGGGPMTSMENHISDGPCHQELLTKRNQGTSMPSEDLSPNRKDASGQKNSNLSDSKPSLIVLRTSQLPQDANLNNRGKVPQLDWNKVGLGTDMLHPAMLQAEAKKTSSLRPKPSTFDKANTLCLDLSTLKQVDLHPLALCPREMAHEQLQSERNAPTTERGFGVDPSDIDNANVNQSEKSLKSLPEGRKVSGLMQLLNKGSVPGLGKTEQLSKGKLTEHFQKQNSQMLQGQDSILDQEDAARQEPQNERRFNSGLGQANGRGVSPNAIERNVMQRIEKELFEIQKKNDCNQMEQNDGNAVHYVDQNQDIRNFTQQLLGAYYYDDALERQQLKFLLTGGDAIDKKQQAQIADIQPVGYKAYSKIKKQSRSKQRSQTPNLLSYLNTVQIKPRLYLHNQHDADYKQYPTLLSPVKLTIDQQKASSRAKAQETYSNSLLDSELICQTKTQETMQKQQVPMNLEIKVHREITQPMPGKKEQDLAVSTERQASEQTQLELTNGYLLQTARELSQVPAAGSQASPERDQIDLSKLDQDPASMDKFEKLLLKLNPFSMNQIQKLSPKNNQVIDNFMDAKKWRKLQQIDQLQFDQVLRSVIQNWAYLRGSSPMYSEFKEEKNSSNVRDRDTPTQPVLLSKLSDKLDVETQGAEKGKESQRSRLSKLSERLVEWDKKLKKKRQSYDHQQRQSERSSSITAPQQQQKILFKTHIKVSPVEGKYAPDKMIGKKSILKQPLKAPHRNSKELISRFSKGMIKIDQILRNQPEINIKHMKSSSFQGRPNLEQMKLKYRLDQSHGVEDARGPAMIRIQSIECNGRNQAQSKIQTPTSIDEPLSHRLERSLQKTVRSDEKKKEIQIVDGSQDQSSEDNANDVDNKDFLSQKTLTRKNFQTVRSASKQGASSGMMTSNAAFSFANKEGSRGAMYPNRSKHLQNRNKMILPENYISIYGQADQEGVKSEAANNNSSEQHSKGHQTFLGRNYGPRDKQTLKIDEWTNNSNESLELPQEVLSNTVTFGSRDPKSRSSQYIMQIKGKKITHQPDRFVASNLEEQGNKNGEVFKLALLSAQQMDLQSLIQHVATMRKMQIREQERDLQKIKNLLREFQSHGIDKGSTNLGEPQMKSRSSNTPGPEHRRTPCLATVHLDHLRHDQIGMHAESPAEAQKRELDQQLQSHSPGAQKTQQMQALEFLHRKFLQRRKDQQTNTSQGTRTANTSGPNARLTINQDLSVLQDPKTTAVRNKQVLQQMTAPNRCRLNNSLLLQPLRQRINPQGQSEDGEQTLGKATSRKASINPTLYQRIISKDEEEFSRSSYAPQDVSDGKKSLLKQVLNSQRSQSKNGGNTQLTPNREGQGSQPNDQQQAFANIKLTISTDPKSRQPPELGLEGCDVRTKSAIGMQTDEIGEVRAESVLVSQSQSAGPSLLHEKVETMAETNREAKDQSGQLTVPELKTLIPENIVIQVEESSLENAQESKTQVAEVPHFETCSLTNPAPLVDQYSQEDPNVLSGGTVGDSVRSGNELQRRPQSPDIKVTLQSSKSKQRPRVQPTTASTLCNTSALDRSRLPQELSSMVVQGNASILSRAREESSHNQGVRVEDQIYERIRQPERNSRTADPAKGHLIRHKTKLYQNFRRQKNLRKERQAEQSKMAEPRQNSLRFDSKIINYQSPRRNTPGAHYNLLPGIFEAQKYYGALGERTLQVDKAENHDASVSDAAEAEPKRLHTERTDIVDQTGALSGQGEPTTTAIPARSTPKDMPQHQQKIQELHKKAQHWLTQNDPDENKQKEQQNVLKLDLKLAERAWPALDDPADFTHRLQRAHKHYTQHQQSRPLTQDTNQTSFRSQQSRPTAAAPLPSSPIRNLHCLIQTHKLPTASCRSPPPMPTSRPGPITIPTTPIRSPPRSLQAQVHRPVRVLPPPAPGTLVQTTGLQPQLLSSPVNACYPTTATSRLHPVFRGFTPLLAGRPRVDGGAGAGAGGRPPTEGAAHPMGGAGGVKRVGRVPFPAATTAFARPIHLSTAAARRMQEESKAEDSRAHLSSKRIYDEMFSDKAIAELEQRVKEEIGDGHAQKQ